MFFLKKTTINSWDELKKPCFVDGIIDQEPYSNTRITSDLNFNDKIYMTLTQNKEKFEYWIDFEQKDGVIKFVNISTGNNFGLVTWNLILTIVLIYISIYFDFYLILVACLIIIMRLYTFMIIRNSNILLKLHLEYIFKIYFIKLKTGVIV
ncbi:hypothetical protein [Daejeonella sp.]|uniref:hypothetical protein n=1 Tax=Daejeonella sp. TaxID=2805397 RepID=UPI0025B85632|nr:hypothetical protein [Daejeonella sp.]